MIDLIAIRARDEDDYATAEVLRNIQWAGNTDPELTATINMVADRHALLAAYDALAAENAALRKDAERYRHVWDNWPLTFGEMLQNGYGVYPIENKAQGDAAIDAAMEQSQ